MYSGRHLQHARSRLNQSRFLQVDFRPFPVFSIDKAENRRIPLAIVFGSVCLTFWQSCAQAFAVAPWGAVRRTAADLPGTYREVRAARTRTNWTELAGRSALYNFEVFFLETHKTFKITH